MGWYGMGGGMGWGGWLFGAILLAGIVTLVVVLVRTWGAQRPSDERRGPSDAEAILAERYARGEIDDDEYRQRLNALRGE